MADIARAFAQKMGPGYYVRRLPSGEFRCLWVMNNWGSGKVNGYVKATLPCEYTALEWLVQRGCPLRGDLPEDVLAEAEAIRERYKEVAESDKRAAEIIYAESVNCAPTRAEDKDTCSQFALVQEGALDEEYEAYEPVGSLPADAVPADLLSSPADAPEAISRTPPTEPLVPCEPALVSGRWCGDV